MSSTRPQSANQHRRRQLLRRRIVALLALGATLTAAAGLAAGLTATTSIASRLEIELSGDRLAVFDLRNYETDGQLDVNGLRRAVSKRLPHSKSVKARRALVTYRIDRAATARRAVALGLDGGRIEATATPIASKIAARVLKQQFRNNCESAALSSLLSARGVRVSQTRLQNELPRSGPADPRQSSSGTVWGDPDQGFVGRVDGGGTAGGFGVYPGPIAALSQSHGVRLENLTNARPETIYRRLRTGRPVMAWIGLSDGPYGQWTSPRGKPIRVNWGEHVVVLTGISTDGILRIMNPLEGAVERWDQPTFEAKWELLGRRALVG